MKNLRKIAAVILTMVIFITGCSDSGGSVTAGANSTDTSVAKQEKDVPTEAPTPTEVPIEAPTELPTPTEEPIPTEAADPNIVRGFDFTTYNTEHDMFTNFKEIQSENLMLCKLNSDYSGTVVSEVIFDGEHVNVGEAENFYLYTPKNVPNKGDLKCNILDEYGADAVEFNDYGGYIEVDGKKVQIRVWGVAICTYGHEKDFVDKPLTIDVTYEDGTTGSITVYTTRVNE